MAVHVPFSLEAKVTARLFTYVFSNESLVSSYWDPISVPTQDMLIGLYLLTIRSGMVEVFVQIAAIYIEIVAETTKINKFTITEVYEKERTLLL